MVMLKSINRNITREIDISPHGQSTTRIEYSIVTNYRTISNRRKYPLNSVLQISK